MKKETVIGLWGVIGGALAVQDNSTILDAQRQFDVWVTEKLEGDDNE